MFSPRLIFLVLLFFFTIAIRFYFYYHNKSNYINGQFIKFETILFSDPQIFSSYQLITANTEAGEKIFIKTTRFPQYNYGNFVRITGTLNERALNNKRIILTMNYPQIEFVENKNNLFYFPTKMILAFTNVVRQKIILTLNKTLPPNSSSLLVGIVFGIKEGMTKDFSENIRIVGVSHVIAASGMNVTMTAGFLSNIFAVLFRRQIALFLSIFGILLYALLAGLGPSIMRASIMGILVFSSQILGRQNLAVYSLFMTAYLMLFASPQLIFDVGFQLSFLATLGLLYLKPLFEKINIIKNAIAKLSITEDLMTTISVQLIALPVLFVNFGTFSLWSILVNALVLWTIPVLMVLGGIGVMVSVLIEPAGQIFLYLALPFLLYFERIVDFFAGFGSLVSIDNLPLTFILGYYCLLFSFIIFFTNKKK